MALTTIKTSNITASNVTTGKILDSNITTDKLAASSVTSTKVDSSIIKTITLTAAQYAALPSYSSSTIYITTP